MARQELGGRVVDQVGAPVEGLDEVGRGQRRVDQQRHAGGVRDVAHGGDVEHVEARVADGLAEQQLGLGPDRGAPAVEVAGLDEGGLDAEAAHRVVQQVLRAAVERGAGHDVRAGAHQRGDRQVQRGLAAGGGDGADAAFERRHALLEHRVGRVADARVDVARALQVEQRRGMVARLEDEGGGEVDRHGARAGGGVGRGAGVQRERVEAGVGIAGHEGLSRVVAAMAGDARSVGAGRHGPVDGRPLWAIFKSARRRASEEQIT